MSILTLLATIKPVKQRTHPPYHMYFSLVTSTTGAYDVHFELHTLVDEHLLLDTLASQAGVLLLEDLSGNLNASTNHSNILGLIDDPTLSGTTL